MGRCRLADGQVVVGSSWRSGGGGVRMRIRTMFSGSSGIFGGIGFGGRPTGRLNSAPGERLRFFL